jgi:phospholipid/cholesterol/gamma-HCH transport system substrate-binding protein
MYSKVNYTIVGVFVILFTAGVIWFAFWLAKYGIHREFDTYKLFMTESVAGLSKDSVVKLRGVDIGRVSEIRIDPKNIEHIEVFLKIKRGVPIKKDMVAHTQMLGVTGLLSIEIDGGTNEAKTLKPSLDRIPVIPATPSWLTRTKNGLGTLSQRVTILVAKTEKLFNKENIETLEKIFDNTQKATAKATLLEDKAINSLEEADMTFQEFRGSLKSMNRRLTQVSQDFKMMQQDFSSIKKVTLPTVDQIMKTAKNFNRMTLKIEKSLDRGDYNVKKIFEPLLVDIGIVSEQINDLAKQLQESPNDLLFKSRKQRGGPGE